jgi:hypothetical protein
MFPLGDATKLNSYLAASAPGVGGALLPQAVFANDSSSGPIAYEQLRMVAFRLDPCFAQTEPITPTTNCENQLRVVFQPLAPDNGTLTAQDAAVHAFYSLTRDQLLAALSEIVAARRHDGGDVDLGPLAPHFLITRDGVGGELAQKLETIVTEYAGAGNLVRFTSLLAEGLVEGGGGGPKNDGTAAAGESDFWDLHGFDVANGSVTPMSIASLPSGTTDESVEAGSVPLEGRIDPQTTSSDNLALLVSMNNAQSATATDRQAAFDAALRIENPGVHSPNTIDCGSCHMAAPARQLVAVQLGLTTDGNANAFSADPSIHAADLTSTTTVLAPDGGLNIHAFSYRGTGPMINTRVINETAANLAYLAPIYEAAYGSGP